MASAIQVVVVAAAAASQSWNPVARFHTASRTLSVLPTTPFISDNDAARRRHASSWGGTSASTESSSSSSSQSPAPMRWW